MAENVDVGPISGLPNNAMYSPCDELRIGVGDQDTGAGVARREGVDAGAG